MFEAYKAYGFEFFESEKGLVYLSNLDEMKKEYGDKMVCHALDLCDLFNYTLRSGKVSFLSGSM